MVSGIPGFVRLPAFAPVYSPKLPLASVGISPEIKLPEAAVQVGVNGTAPTWFVPVTVICDEAELTRKNRARNVRGVRYSLICIEEYPEVIRLINYRTYQGTPATDPEP